MFATAIQIGASYSVKGSYGRGRAVVQEPGKKDRWDNKFHFKVLFPDARPGSKTEQVISSRDFVRVWTEADQKVFDELRRSHAEIDVLKTALTAAGFEPDTIRYITEGELYISYRGDMAKEVVETLVNSVELKNQILELEAHGPHDEG